MNVLPRAAMIACARAMNAAYCAPESRCTSSPPRWTTSPGTCAVSASTTSSTNAYVSSFSTQTELKPTRVPVYGARARPSQLISAMEVSAAFVWPGRSISGTTVMNRSAAYATIRSMSATV